MKVSVIIAAYNAEKYLSETLDSVANQTIGDYEILVVDDGSTDRTPRILEEYRERYPHLRVIRKENGGPSSARNVGLDAARGEYIYFFDADDILELDALECLYDAAAEHDADLVIANYDIFNHYRTSHVHSLDDILCLTEIDRYNLPLLWSFSLCNKLFRRSAIEAFSMRFPPISYSEDGAFLMPYVYRCRRITGLDKVVFHYRRLYEGDTSSITASISPAKMRDYITAHEIILRAAEDSFLRDYPQCASIEEAKESYPEISVYLSELIRKELQVLINQFYAKFWHLEEPVRQAITGEVRTRAEQMDLLSYLKLADTTRPLCLHSLSIKEEEVRDQALFTAVLYADEPDSEGFLRCLKSLADQSFVLLSIRVPRKMEAVIRQAGLLQGNMFFADGDSKQAFFHDALQTAATPYLIFCSAEFAYAVNAFQIAWKHFSDSTADFIIETVNHRGYGTSQPVTVHRLAMDSLRAGRRSPALLAFDRTLANKFFRADFLRGLQPDPELPLESCLDSCYRGGYPVCFNGETVFFEGTEESFLSFIRTEETGPLIDRYLNSRPRSLDSPELRRDLAEVYPKLQKLPPDGDRKDSLKEYLEQCRELPVEDQVLFFSIRRDGSLDSNAEALYPWIRGKKMICARQLPHSPETEKEMVRAICTSKVIITDDYIRYLRHFPLKPEQKVIQLWHACGAFKKFGRRGTNLSPATDQATHAQYSLVCVSSEGVRPIYADAFRVSLQKVQALGIPRTDIFFQPDQIRKKQRAFFARYPRLRKKQILLYAPTFRDIGGERTEFHPDLDFDRLSRELLPGQILLIGPHPVMKNDILEKKYRNIRVVRDFSTNDLMFVSDLLITDYSSVIFEYSLLGRPIVFYCYDLEIYNRGFYLRYPQDLPGEVFRTQEELTRYLRAPERHVITDPYRRFVERYMSACDGHSCERIARLVNDYMEGT